MKGVRGRIRRLDVDFADDAIVAGFHGPIEHIVVKSARMTAPARGGSDHDAVDIDEARIAGAKPEEIRAVVCGVLIEGQQERVDGPYSPGRKCLRNEMLQPLRFEPGQFAGISLLSASRVLPSGVPGATSAEITGSNS